MLIKYNIFNNADNASHIFLSCFYYNRLSIYEVSNHYNIINYTYR